MGKVAVGSIVTDQCRPRYCVMWVDLAEICHGVGRKHTMAGAKIGVSRDLHRWTIMIANISISVFIGVTELTSAALCPNS